MKQFLSGVVLLGFVLGAPASWAAPNGEQKPGGDARAAFAEGMASDQGAFNEKEKFMRCAAFYRGRAARLKQAGGRDPSNANKLAWADKAEDVSFFFWKRYSKGPEASFKKRLTSLTWFFRALDPALGDNQKLVDDMTQVCAAKTELMEIVFQAIKQEP